MEEMELRNMKEKEIYVHLFIMEMIGHEILRRNFALNFFAPKSLKLKKFKKN